MLEAIQTGGQLAIDTIGWIAFGAVAYVIVVLPVGVMVGRAFRLGEPDRPYDYARDGL